VSKHAAPLPTVPSSPQGLLFSTAIFMGMFNAMSVQPLVASERIVFYREVGTAAFGFVWHQRRLPPSQPGSGLLVASERIVFYREVHKEPVTGCFPGSSSGSCLHSQPGLETDCLVSLSLAPPTPAAQPAWPLVGWFQLTRWWHCLGVIANVLPCPWPH
jgi:hypothetical protein